MKSNPYSQERYCIFEPQQTLLYELDDSSASLLETWEPRQNNRQCFMQRNSHTQAIQNLLYNFHTHRHALKYIMETFPIVKRKDEKEYGQYRTKLRILEIYDQMIHCLATDTECHSTINPLTGPPYYENRDFIPRSQWDIRSLPVHIHKPFSNK